MLLNLLISSKPYKGPASEKDLIGKGALEKAAVSPGIMDMAAAAIGADIYIYGGIINGVQTGRLVKYNVQTKRVTTLASGVACCMPALVAYKGMLYAFGGMLGSGALASARRYNPTTNTWTNLTALPAAIYGQNHFVYNDKIYLVSGKHGSTYGAYIVVYTPATNSYASIPVHSNNHQSAGCAFGFHNNLFYMAGGEQGGSLTRIYNPATNSWTTGVSLPSSRSWGGGVVINGKFYVYGGFNAGHTPTPPTEQSSVYQFTPATNSWKSITSDAPPAAHCVSVLCYGRCYDITQDIYLIT